MEPEQIIHAVCYALKLDRDKLFVKAKGLQNEKGQFTKFKLKEDRYHQAECIAAYLIRQKALIPKTTKQFGTEMKQPTYKDIAYVFQYKAHKSVIDLELECHIALREKRPDFKEKYEMVVNLLNPDHNQNIA